MPADTEEIVPQKQRLRGCVHRDGLNQCFISHKVRHDRMARMHEIKRSQLKPGMRVSIVLKKDQRSGDRTEGVIKDILTNSPSHPHGIKVRLESGAVGRVKAILPD